VATTYSQLYPAPLVSIACLESNVTSKSYWFHVHFHRMNQQLIPTEYADICYTYGFCMATARKQLTNTADFTCKSRQTYERKLTVAVEVH
jgi:hypothetical protein